MKTGILLLNLGTPKSTSYKDVRIYLKEFLSDPRVIDTHALSRWILVNLIILPFRTKKTVSAYKKIWQPTGSPLLCNSMQFAAALQQKLGSAATVALGMRYGSPSIQLAIEQLADCDKVIILPLFPQYSSAASGTSIANALNLFASQITIPAIHLLNDFYDQDWFIKPYIELIQNELTNFNPDHILFSYHGLPQRQIKKSGCEIAGCNQTDACPAISESNRYCYRAQCFATTAAITQLLNLPRYSTAFQSRLGRTAWIKPYLDLELPRLFDQGIKRLAIVCPSFTMDCLETLEEINIRAKEQWLSLGGEDLLQVSCLNANESWVNSVYMRLLQIL